ncbi:MAG: thiol-disulfide oxidoreductase DCC family protein [Methylococcaceae bacterium]|jgi:predicted DCC family thiol-disulfide oxidoreductase YuxK
MTDSKLTVLYDGGCPMCSREINHYRRIAGKHAALCWIDVTQDHAALAHYGLTREEALKLFHVEDQSGVMHVGARAFIALWAVLPGYRWLAMVCRMPGIPTALDFIYRKFAGWHFRRRCSDGACDLPRV